MKQYTFQTPALTAQAVTQKLIQALALHGPNEFNLAISGGSTPALLFELWREAYNGKISWNQVNLYWVDERCVGEESTESNYGQAKRGFIDHLVVKPKQVYPIYGKEEPALEAARYSNLVKENLPQHNGCPVFDLVILGIGTDGHTSSIFPGQKWLLESPHAYEATQHPASGQNRIALTARPIYEARTTIFHATGASKAAIIKAMLANDAEREELYPAVYISRRANSAELYTDKEGIGTL
ncbi:MAG: 6-phosphogluconolactonase [Phocaeicola sp.]